MTTKKTSKAEVRRLLEQRRLAEQSPVLATALEKVLRDYRPRGVDDAVWVDIRPTLVEIIERSTATKASFLRNQCTWATQLLVWAHEVGLDTSRRSVLRSAVIDRFVAAGLQQNSPGTRATKRSELRRLARSANPAWDGDRPTTRGERRTVKAPYTDRDVAAIVRVARSQPSELRRQQLSTMVALGLGAGLRPSDLRGLLRRHIDLDTDPVVVQVQGRHARCVQLLPDYRDLLVEGLQGLRPGGEVLRVRGDKRNLTNRIVEDARIVGSAPAIDQQRLRSTWLARRIADPTPLLDLLTEAGLQTAKSLVEIARVVLEREDDR